MSKGTSTWTRLRESTSKVWHTPWVEYVPEKFRNWVVERFKSSSMYGRLVTEAKRAAADDFNRNLMESERHNAKVNGSLEANIEKVTLSLGGALKEARAERDELEGKLTEVGAELEKSRIALAHKEGVLTMQKEAAQYLFGRTMMSERLIEEVPRPVLLLDNDLSILAANNAFKERFGYDSPDLEKAVEHAGNIEIVRGASALDFVMNRSTLRKLGVLNNFFHPRSRDNSHYDLCLNVMPKSERDKPKRAGLKAGLARFAQWLGYESRNPVPCMAYATVALDDHGRFIGVSLVLDELSKAQARNVGVGYITSREADVTVAHHVKREDAESYLKQLTRLYTQDLLGRERVEEKEGKKPKLYEAPELSGQVTFDFLGATKVDPDAAEVFMQMYNFCRAREGNHIELSLINMTKDVRDAMHTSGIPADWPHSQQKPTEAAAQEYEVKPGAEPSPEHA